MEKRVEVKCYAGYKADERPTSFSLDGRNLQVLEILDRWHDPDYHCFKVLADNGVRYLIKHDLNADAWLVRLPD